MRVLIATVTAGGGHLAAAAAMDEAWRSFRPEDTVDRLDLVKFFNPLHRTIHADGYVKIVEHVPEVWGMMFKKTDSPELARRLNKWRRAFPSKSRLRFTRFLNEFKPDIVLCTHYLPLEALAMLRAKEARPHRAGVGRNRAGKAEPFCAQKAFIVSIVTDFEAHAFWMDPCVNLYCVAAEATKARLVARGAAAETVIATGIPVSTKFAQRVDADALRKRMGLRDDLPTLLVLSGGFGMGPVAEILSELDKSQREFQTVVVTGRNQELRRDLAGEDHSHPTHILGYASNMHELMGISDLIITKPGGLTSSEALAVGKPLCIINPIPGQEAANSDFLLERGAAAKVNRVEDLPFRLDELLGSAKLREMAAAARMLGRPQAALEICRQVTERLPTPAHQGEPSEQPQANQH